MMIPHWLFFPVLFIGCFHYFVDCSNAVVRIPLSLCNNSVWFFFFLAQDCFFVYPVLNDIFQYNDFKRCISRMQNSIPRFLLVVGGSSESNQWIEQKKIANEERPCSVVSCHSPAISSSPFPGNLPTPATDNADVDGSRIREFESYIYL